MICGLSNRLATIAMTLSIFEGHCRLQHLQDFAPVDKISTDTARRAIAELLVIPSRPTL